MALDDLNVLAGDEQPERDPQPDEHQSQDAHPADRDPGHRNGDQQEDGHQAVGQLVDEHVDEDLGLVLDLGRDGDVEQLPDRLMEGMGQALIQPLDRHGPVDEPAGRDEEHRGRAEEQDRGSDEQGRPEPEAPDSPAGQQRVQEVGEHEQSQKERAEERRPGVRGGKGPLHHDVELEIEERRDGDPGRHDPGQQAEVAVAADHAEALGVAHAAGGPLIREGRSSGGSLGQLGFQPPEHDQAEA